MHAYRGTRYKCIMLSSYIISLLFSSVTTLLNNGKLSLNCKESGGNVFYLQLMLYIMQIYKVDSQELFNKTSGFRVHPHGIKRHCMYCSDRTDLVKTLNTSLLNGCIVSGMFIMFLSPQ